MFACCSSKQRRHIMPLLVENRDDAQLLALMRYLREAQAKPDVSGIPVINET